MMSNFDKWILNLKYWLLGDEEKNIKPKVIPVDAAGNEKFTASNPGLISVAGSNLVEQKTQADAVANVITFSANISAIEIYHEELTWQTFTVNGLLLVIPSGGYRTPVGGTAAATVTIPAGISCLVGRLV